MSFQRKEQDGMFVYYLDGKEMARTSVALESLPPSDLERFIEMMMREARRQEETGKHGPS
jgi:hypothetical protein